MLARLERKERVELIGGVRESKLQAVGCRILSGASFPMHQFKFQVAKELRRMKRNKSNPIVHSPILLAVFKCKHRWTNHDICNKKGDGTSKKRVN